MSLCSTALGQESYCTRPRAVRASQGFPLLCTVRALARVSLQRLCASVYRTSASSFARCEPTKAFVPLCTIRAPRALRGASLHRLCTSVCCKPHELRAVRTCKGFLPCEPTKAFYRASLQRLSTVYERQELCAVRASKGFLTCTSAKSFARCEPPKALCLCVL